MRHQRQAQVLAAGVAVVAGSGKVKHGRGVWLISRGYPQSVRRPALWGKYIVDAAVAGGGKRGFVHVIGCSRDGAFVHVLPLQGDVGKVGRGPGYEALDVLVELDHVQVAEAVGEEALGDAQLVHQSGIG